MKNSIGFAPQIRGTRSLAALTWEDFTLTTALYAIFALYCTGFQSGLVGVPTLFLATFVYIIRVFTIRHEKSHKAIKEYRGLLGIITKYYTIYHTPYQEPYLEKQRKHLAHHKSHMKSAATKSYIDDPHQILEDGTWYGALFKNLFYEEIMFFLDLRKYGKIRPDRIKMMIVTLLGITLIGSAAGWSNLLTFIVCYRISMALVWYFFSYILHTEPFYSHSSEAVQRFVPSWMLRGTDLIFGSSNATVVMFHKFHHENPNKFFRFED